MSRQPAIPLFALAALVSCLAGCGRSDRSETTSVSAGARTPVVSGTTSDSAGASGETAIPPKAVTYERAESTYAAGAYPEASGLFSSYTESNPENPWGHYMLGLSAWKSGDRERALSAFDRSLELDSSHRKSLFNSSRVLLEMGRPQEALSRIEQALTQEPMSNEGLRLLGRTQYQLGKVDDAIEAYRRALVVDDEDVWSLNNLGLIYLDQNRSSEALPPLARAVQLKGNSPVFQNNLGTSLERSGYPVAAAEAYEAAIKVDSTYQKASVALARVTGSGQQPESEPIDLAELAQRFQSEIESARGDSAADSVQSVSDSTTSSIEAVGDTVENSDHGE